MEASESETTIEIPDSVPVMTLPNTVLFPQAILPLHIFEQRYRKMLQDVLETNRLFAIAGLNQQDSEEPDQADDPKKDYYEPPFPVATVGMVRASHENEDGTSNLILQGLFRVRFEDIITETPYRRARISPIYSSRQNLAEDLEAHRSECLRLIRKKLALGGQEEEEEAFQFLAQIHDPDNFIDLACFSVLGDVEIKQQMLELTVIEKRFQAFEAWILEDIRKLELFKLLKGNLLDEDIQNN